MTTPKTIFMVWCEWDLALGEHAYETADSAIAAAKQALLYMNIEATWDDLVDDLIGLTIINLYP